MNEELLLDDPRRLAAEWAVNQLKWGFRIIKAKDCVKATGCKMDSVMRWFAWPFVRIEGSEDSFRWVLDDLWPHEPKPSALVTVDQMARGFGAGSHPWEPGGKEPTGAYRDDSFPKRWHKELRIAVRKELRNPGPNFMRMYTALCARMEEEKGMKASFGFGTKEKPPRPGHSIISIRGTSGSGKSTIIHTVLDRFPHTTVARDRDGRPEVYRVEVEQDCGCPPLFILGRYEAQCGGCDAMKDYSLRVPELVKQFLGQGHVAFEGLLVSGAYGKIGEALERYGARVIYAFLDTPLETCVQRIEERRRRQGKPPLGDHKNTESKFRAVQATKKRIAETDARIETIDHQDAVNSFLSLLGYEVKTEDGIKKFGGNTGRDIRSFF